MPRRLPPLNALRVFEVAGRHLSFSRAADELCVTNAAVSHQIKQLEDHLGLKLFRRRNNQLTLTDAGDNYLPRVRDALRALEQATDLLMGTGDAPLRVAVPPTFGAKWLVPRLYRFFNQHPQVRVEVSTADVQDHGQFDLCIDDRQVSVPGLRVEWFTATDFFPVCSAALQPAIRLPQDLATQTLLHERGGRHLAHHPTWQQWLDEVGVRQIDAARGPAFSEALMAMQAAIDGQGVALGQGLLVEYDIAAGRLVRPLATEASLRLSYYLIHPHQASENPGFALFRQWLIDELARGGGRGRHPQTPVEVF
ncbi:transcriptional regulator GcvA [Ralstonia pseudosolanacearum]|uniref:Probable transcription regulator protein n=1 Tax=Ralstonia nicotianae (strain ATCC BAA-1114 / GMI1000) TaxID=267608 RepID=Q8XVR8_RALN1|nr:transcriptional regulator GcvA [Ralstonia pseudosolanacearum]BCL91087.1 transcriptional regulator GcvA [Ralstonia solanacearum]AST28269.1 LysR family transcriptional regulator [Ralstonia pseudosolanacearum]MDC6284956.1 transcriptional regulator GcvA [Ralstonia pseudosolanacearum]CAD16468.1 probable transcription regulator protein [Ralstonia pseudosolanacearum GMI1000]BCL98537.1 transcriptional regulator GcvA [Ralstonia solanacearum]